MRIVKTALFTALILSTSFPAYSAQQTLTDGQSYREKDTIINANFTEVYGRTDTMVNTVTAGDNVTVTGSSTNVTVNSSANLTDSETATTVTINSSAGTDVVLSSADATHAGILTAADKVLIDTITDKVASITAGDNVTLTGTATDVIVSLTADLTDSATATTVTVSSSAGTDAELVAATSSTAGILTAADKVIIDSVPIAMITASTDRILTTEEALNFKVTMTAAGKVSLPTAVAGDAGCVTAGQGVTQVIGVQPASGDYIVYHGVRQTAATEYKSGGALGDGLCFIAVNDSDWEITGAYGTWAE
jgi:hypothetical protein